MDLSLIGILFSALTGCALALFYLLNKQVAGTGKPLVVVLWIFGWHLPLFLVWFLLSGEPYFSPHYFLPGGVLLALTIIGNLLTLKAISLSSFSLMVPVLGLSPVFSSLFSIILLNEWPSAPQWLGIVLSVIGVLVLYAPEDRPWDIFSFWPGFRRERGARYMAVAALIWALSAPLDRLALRDASPSLHALLIFTGFTLVFLFWLSWRGDLRAYPMARQHWPLLILTGCVGAVCTLFQLLALQHTPAGPFEAIKRVMGQLLALGLGYVLYKESLSRPKLAGIAILSIGVPLIVL
jgi:drug/metabolite transporter (DMT)-like permease